MTKNTPQAMRAFEEPFTLALTAGIQKTGRASYSTQVSRASSASMFDFNRDIYVDGENKMFSVPSRHSIFSRASETSGLESEANEGVRTSPDNSGSGPNAVNGNPDFLSEKRSFVSQTINGRPYSMKFKSYFHAAFQELRRSFGKNDEYFESLSESRMFYSLGALANSGSRFYYTGNSSFVIKTLPHKQVKFFKKIFSKYAAYLNENPRSSLCKIFGLYRVSWSEFTGNHHKTGLLNNLKTRTEYVIVMDNGMPHTMINDMLNGGHGIDVYDLKAHGLLHKRDNKDLAKFVKQENLNLGERLRQSLKNDVEFLKQIGVNDYSLLVGVARRVYNFPHSYFHYNEDGRRVYVVLIDILSPWHAFRKTGHYLLPGLFRYFPRFARPSNYAKRMRKTIDVVVGKN